MKVYLAGPISGYDYKSVNDWREDAHKALKDFGINGYSPLRGKCYLTQEEIIADSYSDHTMSSITGINVRDYNDCKNADAILVNFLDSSKVSIGTVMEVAWGRAFQIPTVLVMDPDNVHKHGMLTFGNIVVPTLEEGIEAIVQLLKP